MILRYAGLTLTLRSRLLLQALRHDKESWLTDAHVRCAVCHRSHAGPAARDWQITAWFASFRYSQHILVNCCADYGAACIAMAVSPDWSEETCGPVLVPALAQIRDPRCSASVQPQVLCRTSAGKLLGLWGACDAMGVRHHTSGSAMRPGVVSPPYSTKVCNQARSILCYAQCSCINRREVISKLPSQQSK